MTGKAATPGLPSTNRHAWHVINRLLLTLALITTPEYALGNEPVRPELVGRGVIDLELIRERPLPHKYANTRLIKLDDANNDGKMDVVFLNGPRPTNMAGYTGRVTAYTWADTGLKKVLPRPPGDDGSKGCSFKEAYSLSFHDGVVWAGQDQKLMYCHPTVNDWWGTYDKPGHLGLPIRDARVLNVGDEQLFMLSFVSSIHFTPGPVHQVYKLVAFRQRQELVPVAELDTLLRGHALYMEPGDFDGDGVDELAISTRYGDSSDLYHLTLSPEMDLRIFAEGVGGGGMGAGDIDADGRVELLAGGYRFWDEEKRGKHCFEWRDGAFVFDRLLILPDPLPGGSLGVGDVLGDDKPEMVFLRGNEVKFYSFVVP